MRVFVAVELSEELRASLDALEKELEPDLPGAGWVSPENLHLTLRFVGETSGETAGRLAESLKHPLAAVEPFSLAFAGLGVFPGPRRARVLWVGVPTPPAGLFQAQSAVEQAVRAAGLAPDSRRFEPHLTLARFKRPAGGLAALLLTETARREIGTVTVSAVTCFESQLGPRRAAHRVLARVALGSGQGPPRLL